MSRIGVFWLAVVVAGGVMGDYGAVHHSVGPLLTGYGIAVAACGTLWRLGRPEIEEAWDADVVAALLAEIDGYDPDDWLAEPPTLARAALIERRIVLGVEDDGRWNLRAEDEEDADELTWFFARNILRGDTVGGRVSLAAA